MIVVIQLNGLALYEHLEKPQFNVTRVPGAVLYGHWRGFIQATGLLLYK